MRIAEIFYSVQGEGRLCGVPSVFVRTSGCNLRCTWCDTPYTSWRPEGEEWSVDRILREVQRYPACHAVITGGEPFLAPEIEEMTYRLKESKFHITVETAATIFKPVLCDLISLSPKLSNSTPWKRAGGKFASMHEGRRLNIPVIQEMIDRYDYQLKFVIEGRSDLREVDSILSKLQRVDRALVMLMAQAKSRAELRRKAPRIMRFCKESGFSYSPRLQIELFGNRRGT